MRRGSKIASSKSTELKRSSIGFTAAELAGGSADTPAMHAETIQFKKSVHSKFQTSLRTLAEERLFELTSGEFNGDDRSEDCDSLAGSLRLSPRSPRAMQISLGNLSRVASAPSGLLGSLGSASSQASPRPSSGSRPGTALTGLGSSPRSNVDLPPIDVHIFTSDKWGSESADRFRLFCTVKNSFGKYAVNPAEAASGVGYRCQLCRRVHTMNVSCFA